MPSGSTGEPWQAATGDLGSLLGPAETVTVQMIKWQQTQAGIAPSKISAFDKRSTIDSASSE